MTPRASSTSAILKPATAAIAERNGPTDPEALALGGRDLVAHPLADHLALELGKGEQHVEGKPAHAGGRVERLGDRHEGHPVFIEQVDQLREVGERAGEAVDLIDHHNGDLASPNIRQEVLQGRAIEGGSREVRRRRSGPERAASPHAPGS